MLCLMIVGLLISYMVLDYKLLKRDETLNYLDWDVGWVSSR